MNPDLGPYCLQHRLPKFICGGEKTTIVVDREKKV